MADRHTQMRQSQIRLYCDVPLGTSRELLLESDQAHYLHNVMRKSAGDRLAVFNGRDGCFLAEITSLSRKAGTLLCLEQQEAQWYGPDLWLLFAPVKKARLDFMAQKATELGASVIWPVRTAYCQVKQLKDERLQANAIEAAEQTERLDIPEVRRFSPLGEILQDWPSDRALLFCDERLAGDHKTDASRILSQIEETKAALLIGPEGGFSMAEKQMIDAMPQSYGLSLGPRILRSDTAALAALSLYQAMCGDWRS